MTHAARGIDPVLTGDLRVELVALLTELKPFKVDAPMALVARLAILSELVDKVGEEKMAGQLRVLLLAVAPLDDHAERPEGLPKVSEWILKDLLERLETTESVSPV